MKVIKRFCTLLLVACFIMSFAPHAVASTGTLRYYEENFIFPYGHHEYDRPYYYNFAPDKDIILYIYPASVAKMVYEDLMDGYALIVCGEAQESFTKWYDAWCNGRRFYISSNGSDNLNRGEPVPQTIHVDNPIAPMYTLRPGYGFWLSGVIKSEYLLTNISAYIYNNADHEIVKEYHKDISSYSYNIASDGLDASFRFGTLGWGTYRYVVEATNQNGPYKLIDTYFNVSPISITGEVSPKGILARGRSFGIAGVITAGHPLGRLYAVIYNSSGDVVVEYEKYVESNTYNIRYDGLNDSFLFGRLEPGYYKYEVNVYGTNNDWPARFGSEFRIA